MDKLGLIKNAKVAVYNTLCACGHTDDTPYELACQFTFMFKDTCDYFYGHTTTPEEQTALIAVLSAGLFFNDDIGWLFYIPSDKKCLSNTTTTIKFYGAFLSDPDQERVVVSDHETY